MWGYFWRTWRQTGRHWQGNAQLEATHLSLMNLYVAWEFCLRSCSKLYSLHLVETSVSVTKPSAFGWRKFSRETVKNTKLSQLESTQAGHLRRGKLTSG